jgi:VIT1/CCC1 family predicted Fe2+/Mn2+ transporter
LVAGAMSMAAGEYVSVSSQADTEHADLTRERSELKADPVAEENELAEIYVKRGLDLELAKWVARELMATNALAAHAQDELGISQITTARPIQAAMTSALTFSVGAAMPLLAVLLSPEPNVVASVTISSLAYLGVLGAIGAKAGGVGIMKPQFA